VSGIDELAPSPAPPGADPQAVADAITAEARTSFSTGMRVLARPRRAAMHAIYAFARVVDDIADSAAPEAEKRRLLGLWREEIGQVYAGRPGSAIGAVLAEAVARYELPREEFLLLIGGMEMDAGAPIVAPPLEVLRAYTRRVAGAVGVLSMRVFGAWEGARSEEAALRLGDAFQLTNILRDVEEDAARGRLYLPREALDAAGVPAEPGAAMAPALLMTGVYEGYLGRMEARGFRRDRPLTMSRPEKLARGLICLAGPIARGHG
jgi:phytoene synthase